VGKIAISDLILLKPGKLTDEEFAIMRSHAAIGAALLSEERSEVVRVAERIAPAPIMNGGTARPIHSNWRGSKYPRKYAS
jgi:putative two-component system response regulator